MDSITSALAANQALYQNQLGLAALKMAVQGDQQVAAVLTQAVQAGQALASNPPHLGQRLDTYA